MDGACSMGGCDMRTEDLGVDVKILLQ